MSVIWADLRYAWRAAMRFPGVTLTIIAMLALGTGGVMAIFNPIYSTLFNSLPFKQPKQLVLIGGDIPIYNHSFSRFEKEQELNLIFSNMATYAPFSATLAVMPGTGKNKEVAVVDVCEDFFETLGVQPVRGSDFKRSKSKTGYIISNRFWRNELMGADDAIGRLMRTEGIFGLPLPIIGIMPESFDFPSGTDIWMHRAGGGTYMSMARQYLGRVHLGMPVEAAAKELRNIEFKPGNGLLGRSGPLLQSLQTVLRGDRKPLLFMLGSAAVLFLTLVCSGVMNLLITQGARRKSEMAMRLIFGASRRNLVFQLLRETLPLVLVGALAGLWLSEIVDAWLMARFPLLNGGEVIAPVKMAFFVALVFAVTVIGGLTPALYASGVDLNTYLKSGSDSKRRFFPFSISLREMLVGVQLSLALALLIGVGLLVSSMMFHVDIPIRWSSREMAVLKVQFPMETQNVSSTPEAMTRHALFFQEFKRNLSTMPEVASVGIFNPIPFSAEALRFSQRPSVAFKKPPGGPLERREEAQVIEGRANPEGFNMLGLSLIAGRYFSSTEQTNEIEFQIRSKEALLTERRAFANRAGGVVIINHTLARQFWPGENAIGNVIYNGLLNSYEIIGVVRDFYQVGDNKNFSPAVYYPPDDWLPAHTFLIKLHSGAFIKDLRQRLSGLDLGLVTYEVQSLGDIVHEATARTRMTIQLLGSFTILGIVIAGMGVYATTSLMATAWKREMGIRIAMGAQTWDILRLALWRGTRAILLGLPLGLFLAWILSRALSSYLFHVKVNDLSVWVTSCALLLTLTIIAAFIPSFRATCVNPLDALRDE